MSDSEDLADLEDIADVPADGGGGDDLFGDGSEDDDTQAEPTNLMSDDELASDHDAPTDNGHGRTEDVDMELSQGQSLVKEKLIQRAPIFRHRTPLAKDGMLRSLKMPSFVKIAADEYKVDEFEATEWDRENMLADKPKSVVRFQKDAQTGKLKSNAIVYRWSDGSATLCVGSDHYEMQTKRLAPKPDEPYRETQDSHYYAAAAHLTSELLVTVGHISEQYTVLPSRNMQDEALAEFQNKMAAANLRKAVGADNIITATRDPELQRKEAELAEKERIKAQRKRENAAARLGGGSGSYRSGGLSIGDLEGGRKGSGGGRKRGQPGASKPKKRKPEYDSDDDLPAGRGRNDDYDHEDDFIAPSDDENASGGGAEDEDDELLDDGDEVYEAPRKKKQKTADAEEEDADGGSGDDAPTSAQDASRARRRRVMDEEDDDEDDD